MKNRLEEILKQYWGYDSFRGIQREIITSVCEGRDTLGLMPTGGGKSICFQVPGLYLDGLCIVVTPLISLMKDQVQALKKRDIKAEAVFSGMRRDDIVRVLDNCILGDYKFLYISPERLASELFRIKLAYMKNVSMIVVDEAHCVSQWGYDFRPSYLKIAEVRGMLPKRVPVLALTATATPKVVDDIQDRLMFAEKNVFRMSFERKNLVYVVRECSDTLGEALHILKSVEGSAILYVRSRDKATTYAEYFRQNGITADAYHAGLTAGERDFRQEWWMRGKTRLMVATNAFCMGIDKPDVRLVLHLSPPDSIEAYFQEAGRAGRDGNTSYAVLLCTKGNVTGMPARLASTYPDIDYVKETYENVCCFLQVGVGEAKGKMFYFSMDMFCRNFHQFENMANSALVLLSNAGYIEYEEEREFKTAVQFVVRKEELYKLDDDDAHTDKLIQAILRNYCGVFAEMVYIDEMMLSHDTGLTPPQIYYILKDLKSRRIINFIPRKKTPTISFPIGRVDTSEIVLKPSVYADRKADMEQRLKSMQEYVSRADMCRSVLLLQYFGEYDAPNCGRCDVCLEAKRNGVFKLHGRDELTELLADGEWHNMVDIKELPMVRDALHARLRQLTMDEQIETDGVRVRLKKSKDGK